MSQPVWLRIEGARQNNLKNVSVDIPHDRVTVVTGVSGSGKSSLAFDTLFAEGQWRYIESLSTYARMFLERLDRPDVDRIEHIRPAIALEQKNPVRTARSTVGTATELYDYLRLLFAKIGRVHCPTCGAEAGATRPTKWPTPSCAITRRPRPRLLPPAAPAGPRSRARCSPPCSSAASPASRSGDTVLDLADATARRWRARRSRPRAPGGGARPRRHRPGQPPAPHRLAGGRAGRGGGPGQRSMSVGRGGP